MTDTQKRNASRSAAQAAVRALAKSFEVEGLSADEAAKLAAKTVDDARLRVMHSIWRLAA